MATLLRTLLLEDSPLDAELLEHELRRSGFAPIGQRVDTEEDYLASLDPSLDVILADYNLPQFDALRALHLLQERKLEIPFIVVTGAIGEEKAVECVRQGAVDYLLKDRLTRLGEAVRQALQEKELRAEKRRAELALQSRAAQQAALARLGQLALSTSDLDTVIRQAAIQVARTLEVRFSEVLELVSDGGALLLRAGVGWREGLVEQATIPVEQDPRAGYVLLRNESVVIEDLRIDSRFEAAAMLYEHGVVSGMSVPISGERQLFGLLAAHSDDRCSFTAADLHFLESMANILGQAIERQRAARRLREAADDLERSNRELERTLQQLQHASQAERLFLAATSHDVRGALTVISGFGEILGQQLSAEQGRDMAMRVRDLALTLSDTMMDLLQYGRLAETTVALSESPVAVRDLLRGCVCDIAAQCDAKGLRLKVEVPDEGAVVTDATKLARIVQNLLSNAVRYTPAGWIHLTASLIRAHLQITVRDTGIGIPEDQLDRIFDPFYRSEAAQSLEKYGSGVGLATVKRLCQLLGGEVYVQSAPGIGSAFTVRIPCHATNHTSLAGRHWAVDASFGP